MATIQSIKTKIQGLIDKLNEATGGADTDLTTAIDNLIANQGDGGVSVDELLASGIVGEVESNATTVKAYACYYHANLTKLNLPLCVSVGNYAFQQCTKLEEINLPLCETIGTWCFYLAGLKKICLPKVTTLNNSKCFYGCSSLAIVDLPIVASITGSALFQSCTSLKALILRSETMVTIAVAPNNGTSGMFGTIGVTPYIYVPRALIDTYKGTTVCSGVSSYFRALEDYTVDGTITGAFDESKI